MAQNKALTPLDIYNTLSDDTTFMSHVGQYTFTNVVTPQPALSIVTPNAVIPNLEYVNGLEVVIHDTGSVSRKDFLTNAPEVLTTYQVFLILWDGGSGDDLTGAAQRMVQMFSAAKTIKLVSVRDTVNVLVQSLIEIPNNALILV